MTYSQPFLKRIETSNTKKQIIADYTLNNPIDAELFVNGIVLIADTYFQLKGKCVVLVNGSVVFDETESESFRDINEIPIALTQKKLNRGAKIEVFVWNSIDSDVVALTVSLKLSENQDETFAGAKAVDKQTQRDSASDFESVFPYMERAPNTYTKLLNTNGYKKLTVMISAVSYVSGFAVLNNDYGNQVKDGDLSTLSAFTGGTQTGGIGVHKTFEVDFGSVASRPLVVKATVSASGGTSGGTPHNGIGTTTKISVKNNIGDAWTDLQTTVITASDSENIVDQNVGYNQTQTFRYAKFDFIIDYGYVGIAHVTATVKLYELYISGVLGGSGALSMEIQNSLGEWLEYIAASEFGTVSFLGQSIQKQVGDTNNVSVSGKTYALIAHQSRVRLKYVVSTAPITNAVDIMRVS